MLPFCWEMLTQLNITENPRLAMIVPGRSIITDHDKSHPFIIHQTDSEVEYSRSYPGLKTVYNIHTVKCRVKERPRVFLSACLDGSSMVQWSMWLKNRSATDDDSHPCVSKIVRKLMMILTQV